MPNEQEIENENRLKQIEADIEESGLGYATKNGEYDLWKEFCYVCPWEYCIEHEELTNPRTSKSCGFFGHNCPGGEKKVKECNMSMDTIKSQHVMLQ